MAPIHPSLILTQGFYLELSFCVSLCFCPNTDTNPFSMSYTQNLQKDLKCSVGPQYPCGLNFSHWAASQSSDQPRCYLSISRVPLLSKQLYPGSQGAKWITQNREPLWRGFGHGAYADLTGSSTSQLVHGRTRIRAQDFWFQVFPSWVHRLSCPLQSGNSNNQHWLSLVCQAPFWLYTDDLNPDFDHL